MGALTMLALSKAALQRVDGHVVRAKEMPDKHRKVCAKALAAEALSKLSRSFSHRDSELADEYEAIAELMARAAEMARKS